EPISLDQTIGDEGDSQLGDFIEDSEAVVAVDAVSFSLLQDQLQQVLQTLSEREAGVVRLRFGLTDGQPRTLDEIGQVYGVTRERIRQSEAKTMWKLRHPSRSQVLRRSLDWPGWTTSVPHLRERWPPAPCGSAAGAGSAGTTRCTSGCDPAPNRPASPTSTRTGCGTGSRCAG